MFQKHQSSLRPLQLALHIQGHRRRWEEFAFPIVGERRGTHKIVRIPFAICNDTFPTTGEFLGAILRRARRWLRIVRGDRTVDRVDGVELGDVHSFARRGSVRENQTFHGRSGAKRDPRLDLINALLTQLMGRQGQEILVSIGGGTPTLRLTLASKLVIIHAVLGTTLVSKEGRPVRTPSLVAPFTHRLSVVVIEDVICQGLQFVRDDLGRHGENGDQREEAIQTNIGKSKLVVGCFTS